MRIGIDARFLTHPQRGGFKTYTHNLLTAISRADATNQYFIYVDRSFQPGSLPSARNFTYRILNSTIPLIGMVLREQVLLPLYALTDRLDVLHSLCNTAPVLLPTRRVVTLHDTIQVAASGKLEHISDIKPWGISAYSRWSIARSLHKSTYVITVSEYEKRQIVDFFRIRPGRVAVTHLAPNPIYQPVASEKRDEFRMALQEKFGIRQDYILCVGFEDRKNIPVIIEAYQQLSQDFRQLALVVVCAEPTRKRLFEGFIQGHQLDDRVFVLGSVAAPDLWALYSVAKVLAFPSERESFGLPPVEAISCGTPTIAMNSSSLPEVLGDGALLVDGKSPQKWAAALSNVLTNEVLCMELRDRGIRRASELTWDRCAAQTVSLYRQALSSN